jgi:hypothetical protein
MVQSYRDQIFIRAYDQAICEYGTWKDYKKEQWKSYLYYGPEDLLDLSLSLLSSRRVKYPLAALDLAAYTIKKFELDWTLANMPVLGISPNTRTKENDPVQFFSLHVKFNATSEWKLHFGAHILARCSLIQDNPATYLSLVIENMKTSHDILIAIEREMKRIQQNLCPYEKEADTYLTPQNYALKDTMDFFYDELSPSSEMSDVIKAEVMIEKEMAKLAPIHHFK